MGFFLGCELLIPEAPLQSELLDGPISGLSNHENAQFLAGDIAFNDEVFTEETGLGPFFVATSCGSCHPGDGKGHPFTTLTRFGQINPAGNDFMGNGGPQLQNRALPGIEPEEIPPGIAFSEFTPPAVTGLGLLEALSDQQLLSLADPFDINGDGISGVPNYVQPPTYFVPEDHHIQNDDRYIGRFGKKAAAINLKIQTVNAYKEDMGITSDFESEEPSIWERSLSPDGVPDPEVSRATINDVVFYLKTLKAPFPRNTDKQEVLTGRSTFDQINCSSCHIPEWTTAYSEIEALSFKTFYPYTDLLLHDMGPNLDDGYTEGSAVSSEWRTPPLWGLGLSADAQGGEIFLLHDGRARSIIEAIELHGGEAQASRDQFVRLNPEEKANILEFLNSL